jgi:hypothetical protein
MNICKEGSVRGLGAAEAEDLEAINRLTRRTLTAEEVYTFAVRLCDNDIDRDGERFADETLDQLAELFVGAPGVFDHQWSARGQSARIYKAQVVDEPAVQTADGRPYRWLKGWAYMIRTEDNAALMAEIDGGIKREVSVGCAVEATLCSVCGQPLGSCEHQPGEEYDGQRCHGVLTGATDAYEWSFVAVPAQRKAGVVKSAGAAALEEEARLGRRYLKSLRGEMVRLGGMAQPEADHALLERVAGKLGEGELLGLIKLYRGQTEGRYVPATQLSYEQTEEGDDRADPAFLI